MQEWRKHAGQWDTVVFVYNYSKDTDKVVKRPFQKDFTI